jgi:MFS family permease
MGPAVAWEERRTLVLVNLASIMERADEALLPAVYREVGAALHATPTGLGTLTLYRSIVQAACYPLAAYAASRHNRAHVIAVGAFLWAAATFLVAISETFLQVSPAAQPPLVLHGHNTGKLMLVQSSRWRTKSAVSLTSIDLESLSSQIVDSKLRATSMVC